MKKIWEAIKNFFKNMTPAKAKNLAMVVLIAALVFSVLAMTHACTQRIRNEERAKIAEQQNALLGKENKDLLAKNKALDATIKKRDESIGNLQKDVLDITADRDKIKTKYTNFKAGFIQLSQEGKDKELTALFHKNGIELSVVAADDYIKIIPDERNKLYTFASDASQCFELNQNLTKENGTLKSALNLCLDNEVDLKKRIDNCATTCDNDKTILKNQVLIEQEAKKTWKKNAFWSKVGGGAAFILTVLLLR